MADDDIISLYLKPKDGDTSKPSIATTSSQNDDIIKRYLKTKSASSTAPKPPISGVTAEQSAEINARPSSVYKGGPVTGKTLGDVAIEAGSKGLSDIKSSASQAVSGVSDVFSNKPASGLGKIGSAALGVIGAPSDVISFVGSDLTGSEETGNRLGFIAGVTPVGKVAGPLNPLRIPTPSNLSPIKQPTFIRNKALDQLVNNITSEGRDPQALADTINRMKADSRIGPADTSPAVLNAAQSLFVKEGSAAKNYLFNASKSRVANLPQDVKEAFDTAGGVPVNVVQKLADLSAASKKVGSDLINPALATAKPVDISGTLSSIDNVLKPGVWSKIDAESSLPLTEVKKELSHIRDYLASDTEHRIDANDLHRFQSGLRSTATDMMKSADGGARQVGQALMNVRQSLVKDIDNAAPGYKDALHAYKDEKDIAEAFRHAHDDVFSKSTKMENAPEVTEQWFKGLSDNEKEAAKEGARLAIRSKMGVSDNPSLAGTNAARSEFNQEKMRTIFGKEETDKLLQDLENTRAIKNTDQKIIEGSQTQMRAASNSGTDLPVKGEGQSVLNYAVPIAAEYAGQLAGSPGVGGVLGGAAVAAKWAGSAAKHAIETKLAKERNLHLAKMSLPVEGPDRAKLISDLESFLPQPKQSMLSRIIANRLPISP